MGFNSEKNVEKNQKYNERFFETIFDVFENRDSEYAKFYFMYMYPKRDDLENQISLLKGLIKKEPKNDKTWKKSIEEKIYDLELRLRGYKLLASSIKL